MWPCCSQDPVEAFLQRRPKRPAAGQLVHRVMSAERRIGWRIRWRLVERLNCCWKCRTSLYIALPTTKYWQNLWNISRFQLQWNIIFGVSAREGAVPGFGTVQWVRWVRCRGARWVPYGGSMDVGTVYYSWPQREWTAIHFSSFVRLVKLFALVRCCQIVSDHLKDLELLCGFRPLPLCFCCVCVQGWRLVAQKDLTGTEML